MPCLFAISTGDAIFFGNISPPKVKAKEIETQIRGEGREEGTLFPTPIHEENADCMPLKSPKPQFLAGSLRQDVVSHRFAATVQSTLQELVRDYRGSGSSPESIIRIQKYVMAAAKLDDRKGKMTGPLYQLKATLQEAYISSGVQGMRSELDYLFRTEKFTSEYSMPNLEKQEEITDLRHPHQWYPQARCMHRTIHLHVGPTNSGKTYHALKRLEQAKQGFYAGPLRLLAQEVYQRFKDAGVRCSLITGDDVQVPEDGPVQLSSNTVEMVAMGKQFDVGVIDEIQMIADENRGWAWTRAFLGARVSELHLCGEPRVVPLIQQLTTLIGDQLVIHRYERLSPLKAMDQSLRGNLRKLEKGDCLVSFSRVGIHALKNEIEKTTGRRAAIVYGTLPAEIRTQQAALFNDPNNDYDYLVASDAIGMGLNL